MYNFAPNNGAADTIITLNTSILTSCSDNIEIRTGGASCELLTNASRNNSTDLSCIIGDLNAANASLLAGQPIQMEILQREMGASIVIGTSDPLSRTFFFLPQINTANVTQSGSILGGGTLIIYGSGFEAARFDHIQIALGTNRIPCKPKIVETGKITCIINLIDPHSLSPSSPTLAAIDVQIFNNWTLQWIPVSCASTANCSYTFDIGQTPEVTLIEPLEITSSSATLRINGDKLLLNNETTSDLSVVVSGVGCTQITNLGSGQGFTCVLNGSLPYGGNSVQLLNRIRGAGIIPNNLTVLSAIKVDSVSPTIGSFAGGTPVCLAGNGLDMANITVSFGDSNCATNPAFNRTSGQLCCFTPQHALPTNGGSTTIVNVSVQVSGSSNSSQLTNAFTYSVDYTPQISGAVVEVVAQSNASKISRITITGTLLNTPTNGLLNVTLGNAIPCQITNQTDIQIVCTTNNLKAGTYVVNLMNWGSGRASSTTQVTVPLQLSSITPSSGEHFHGTLETTRLISMTGINKNLFICC